MSESGKGEPNTAPNPDTAPATFDRFLDSIEQALRQKFAGLPNADVDALLAGYTKHDNPNGLTPKEQLLAYALAKGGQSHAELAKLTGFNLRTIASYSSDPRMQRAVSLIQHASGLTDVIQRFKNLTPRAVEVMSEIMNDTGVPASTRLEAAKSIIERIHGKALQPIEATGNLLSTVFERLDKNDEVTSLASELLSSGKDDPSKIN